MTRIARHLFALGITLALAATASAQSRTGGQGGAQGGGLGGGQQMGGGDGVGLVGETVGIAQQQMTTVRNNVVQSSNVLGGYYGNFMYQGQIGTTGASTPGGFGQVMYSTGTTGGMTGFGGATTGNRAGGGGGMTGAGGRATGTNTGFGTSTGTTGFGGATGGGGRAGGTGGFGGGTTGFGGGTTGLGGGLAGGRGGQLGGQFGAMGGRGGAMGGMGQTNPYTVTADRPVTAFFRPAGILPGTSTPTVEKASTDLRGLFDRSVNLTDGKSINVTVAADGIAVLKGTVASDDEKRLAIGLAQITPGVRRVNSTELKVEPKP